MLERLRQEDCHEFKVTFIQKNRTQIRELYLLGVVAHIYNSNLEKQRQEDQEIKTSLGQIVNLRPAWAT